MNNTLNYYLYCIISLILIIGCDKHYTKVTTYHDNGAIAETYYLDHDSVKQGETVDYFPSGRISSITKYTNGDLQDTIFYYIDDEKNELETQKFYINDSDFFFRGFYKGGVLKQEGTYNIDKKKINQWTYYTKEGNIDFSKEYKIIDGEAYTNQLWVMLPGGDTLNEGTSMKYHFSKDKLALKDSIRCFFQIDISAFQNKKVVVTQVFLPKDYTKANFNPDFSNRPKPILGEIHQYTGVPFITLPSIEDSPKPIPDTKDIAAADKNKTVLFYWKPKRIGKDTIRGYLEEKHLALDPNDISLTNNRYRQIYFEFPIEVTKN